MSVRDLAKIRGANLLEPIEQPTLETDSPTPLLVAVFTGAKPTPGYKLRLLGADIKGNKIVLHYALDKPTDAMLAQMITSPCSVVEVSGANHHQPISVRVNGQLLPSKKL
ncbi:MAG: protease complex subunit PrcB family protein [Gammaproteobacteria bacterium]|nr:protease complex subunit PrcB family protein [Gammaproteobacteria bacterium]